jgi:hypothetical protein
MTFQGDLGPLPFYRCGDPTCNPAFVSEIMTSSLDPPQPFGFDYCHPPVGNPPSNPNFIPDSVPGNSCVHPDYYDPTVATDLAMSNSLCIEKDANNNCKRA